MPDKQQLQQQQQLNQQQSLLPLPNGPAQHKQTVNCSNESVVEVHSVACGRGSARGKQAHTWHTEGEREREWWGRGERGAQQAAALI